MVPALAINPLSVVRAKSSRFYSNFNRDPPQGVTTIFLPA